MQALEFWKAVVQDRSNFLERVIGLLDRNGIRYCIVSGSRVNAYAEPIVTQDLDIVVATGDLARARGLLESEFRVREFEHSLKVYDPDSALQVQVQLDERYAEFPGEASRRDVMGLELTVAAPRDLLAGKIWAFSAPARRGSKRQKDLADISRLIEVFPEFRDEAPPDILARLV